MPQDREMNSGISQKRRPSQAFSSPLNSITLNLASVTLPSSPRCRVTLPWPSILVIGSISIFLVILPASTQHQILVEAHHVDRQHGNPAVEKLDQAIEDGLGTGRTPWHIAVDFHDLIGWLGLVQEFRDFVR